MLASGFSRADIKPIAGRPQDRLQRLAPDHADSRRRDRRCSMPTSRLTRMFTHLDYAVIGAR
jgi:hypothetical protein